MNRRDFLRLAALGGGVVFASAIAKNGGASHSPTTIEDFYFVQLSDTHWGFSGDANPEAAHTLQKAVEAVNNLIIQPDFIVFTGDLTHTTDDPKERRRRMAEFKNIISRLHVKNLRFMPGEHDAALDNGEAFKEVFGETHYSFDHKGIHFIAIDNVSNPGSTVGEKQIQWLQNDLSGHNEEAPIIVFTHRPLFDLAPKWDWATRDGAKVIDVLMPYTNLTVFYGHIHQEHHFKTGHISHHAAKSLIFPLPAPGSQEKRTPLPWDPAHPFKGLGFREINAHQNTLDLNEFDITKV